MIRTGHKNKRCEATIDPEVGPARAGLSIPPQELGELAETLAADFQEQPAG